MLSSLLPRKLCRLQSSLLINQMGASMGAALFFSTSAASLINTASASASASAFAAAESTNSSSIEGKQSKKKKKGSFLLNSTNNASKAAQIFDNGNGLKSDRNAEVGRALIAVRDTQMGPNVSVFYKQDGGLVITSGKGVFMYDIDGNQYLDCCNNVAAVGHSHPAVVEAGVKELQQIQTNGRFLHPTRQRYLTKLLATFPPELNTVYLVNSGSEANDLALRIAREHTTAKKAKDVIVLGSAYHGHTQSLIEISPYKWAQATDGKKYKPSFTHVVDCPDSYRGKYRGMTEETGRLYAQQVIDIVNKTGGVGTFIAESIVGCGGQIVLPPTYLNHCYEAVRGAGGVVIADEVQTGFARAGTSFWTFQEYGVVPDIVTIGKPMGNGYPVAAVVCRRELAESFAKTGIEYFNTYGGNSVACSVAEAVLDSILQEGLQDHARRVGEHLRQQLLPLVSKYKWVGDVRGFGLFQGIEFVVSNKSANPKPFPELTKFVVDFLRYERIIISRDGPDENVIKVKPPLVFNEANVDTLVAGIDRALAAAKASKLFGSQASSSKDMESKSSAL